LHENPCPTSPALRSAQRLIALLILIIGCFLGWSLWFDVEQIARSTGQVIASSRTQLVQATNDGVIEKFLVREGGHVKKGDILVMLEREQGHGFAQRQPSQGRRPQGRAGAPACRGPGPAPGISARGAGSFRPSSATRRNSSSAASAPSTRRPPRCSPC
jgi:hypothetical protein